MKRESLKKKRQTLLKRLEALFASGRPTIVTMSGAHSSSEYIDEALREWTAWLESSVLDHNFPAGASPSARADHAMESLLVLLQDALINRRPELFEIVAKVMRKIERLAQPLWDEYQLFALLLEAQRGPVNVMALARQFETGEVPIQSLEKRLRRYCRRLGLPVASAGKPKRPPSN